MIDHVGGAKSMQPEPKFTLYVYTGLIMGGGKESIHWIRIDGDVGQKRTRRILLGL